MVVEAAKHNRSRDLGILALVVGVAGTVLCAYAIYRTAQVPDGDGTGMQWVVLGPLGLLFFGVALPALIFGVNRLRPQRAGETDRSGDARSFRLIAKVLIAVLVIVFGILPLLSALILAFVD